MADPAAVGDVPAARGGRLATVVDQVLSSLTNFALSIVAARELGPSELGSFAVAVATYLILLGVVRAACGEVLLVRHGAAPAARWPVLTRAVTGLAAGAGLLVGSVVALAGVLLSGRIGLALLALAVTLPGLLVQDAWRYCLIGRGRPIGAVVLDATWALLLVPAFAAVLLSGVVSAPWLLLAWGASGVAALPVAWALDRTIPDPALGWAHLRREGQFIRRYSLEFLTGYGAYQFLVYVLAAQFGLGLAGVLRLAQTAVSPVSVLFQGAYTIATLRSVQLRDHPATSHRRWSLTVSGVLAGVAAGWVALLLLVPSGLVVALLGPGWPDVRGVVAVLGLWLVTVGAQSGAATGLHGLADSARSLRAQLVSAPGVVVLGWVGAGVAGAQGVAWGQAAAGGVALIVWWTAYSRALSTR